MSESGAPGSAGRWAAAQRGLLGSLIFRRLRRIAPQLGVTLVVAGLLTAGLVVLRPPACEGKAFGPNDLRIASSQEKFEMLSDLARAYNYHGGYLNEGLQDVRTCVYVNMVRSGDAEGYLETGWRTTTEPRPDVWAPASSAWVLLLKAHAPGQTSLIPPDADRKSLFTSPLVIAMPKPMAESLGSPESTISWQDIHKLATDPAGWGSRGKPEWGPFRIVKTDPHVSTSGLHGLIGMYNAIGADGTPQAVNGPRAQAFARGIENSVLHYGATAKDVLNNLGELDSRPDDPQHLAVLLYVSAIAIEEKQVFDYNNGKFGQDGSTPNVRLVPLYPKEAPIADHPYLILQWPGQSRTKTNAAKDFFTFLTAGPQQQVIGDNGFRQVNGEAGNWLRQQPFIRVQLPNLIPLPDKAVIDMESAAWDNLRRPARVMILIHRRANANDLQKAESLLDKALSKFRGQDRLMVAAFPAQESGAAYSVRQEFLPADPAHLPVLRQAIHVGPQPGGGTAPNLLGSSLQSATAGMESAYDQSAINAILLVEMSPGKDNQPGDQKLLDTLRAQAPSRFVHIFCVGPADNSRLATISRAGQGASYAPDESSNFLRELISNF